MNEGKKKLYLYEALELRGELDARIKTLKDCLPETRQNRGRLSLLGGEDGIRRPSPDFDPQTARSALRKLELKRRKLNSAIQQANFSHHVEYEVIGYGDRGASANALVTKHSPDRGFCDSQKLEGLTTLTVRQSFISPQPKTAEQVEHLST